MVDTDLTLVDYFAVIGFDRNPDHSADVISDFVGASTSNQIQPPLERSYVARVLASFPEKRPGFSFAHEISSLCMPKGLRFYTEKSVPLEPKFHSFVNIREDGRRINGCCLTLYEEVREEQLRQEMVNLQMEHVKDLAMVEKSIQDRVHHPPGTISGGNHTLPRHISARKNKTKRISYYDSTSKPIFVSKCICLITRIPIIYTAEKILRGLADMISVNRPVLSLPMESFIYWFLHEVPLPVAGTKLRVSLNECDLIVKRPSINELPFFDYPILSIFGFLSVDKFVKLFTCFLLEHQILLCSKHLERLMLIAETLLAFIFPFRWHPLAYCPILPYAQLKFIEAPVPYLMGLCYEDKIPDQIYQSNICILDLDHPAGAKIDLPEDVPPFPRHKQLTSEIIGLINKFREFNLAEIQNSTNGNTDSPNKPKVVMRRTTALQNVSANYRTNVKEQWSMKRMSRSFDDHAAITAAELAFSQNNSSIEEDDPLTIVEESNKKNEVERTSSFKMDESMDENFTPLQSHLSQEARAYLQGLKFNNAIRELILYHFCCLFHNYENFLISDTTEHDSAEGYLANRDSVVNFDKASFLSDQPDSYLPFLAAFLESQMFTSFIDSKILSHITKWNKPDENILLFDQKLIVLREKLGIAPTTRTPIIDKPPEIMFSDDSTTIKVDQFKSDYEVPRPHALSGAEPRAFDGIFPDLEPRLFENRPISDQLRSPWKEKRQKQRVINVFEDSTNLLFSPKKKLQDLESDDTDSPKKIAQQNWKFVEQLLKETKTKTKRMLVVKMGKEAMHLGHNDLSITGVEENTLVAGFCDLLERVWAHGLKKKQGKSAFWMHVLSHQEKEKNTETLKIPDNASNMSPAISYQYAYDEPENTGGLADLLESVRQEISNIAKSYEQVVADNPEDSNNWSKSLLRAANFIADKLNTNSNRPVHISTENSTNFDQNTKNSSQNEAGISSSFDQNGNRSQESSWHPAPPPRRSRISATPGPSMDVNKNSDRPPILHRGRMEGHTQNVHGPRSSSTQGRLRMIKVPSFSDFSPNWSSGNGNSVNDPSGSGPPVPLHRHRAVSHERKRSLSRPRSPVEYEKQLSPLSTHISYDLKNILRMTEIKTDIGFARAFVRLALERKLLYKHLKSVLSNATLLQKMYKRYAFLRCEEEREQFLYHILSLNAVDYTCFTHTFISTKMQYEVLVVAGIDRYHASSIWVMITGSLGSTNNISLPTNSLQFTFDHKNLGVLSTMRIGHILREKEKNLSKWFLDYVLVRNNITGQTFRYNCGRWFGRGVDDGALERLLVADVLPRTTDLDPESGMSSFGSTSSFGGLISRPESPVSSVMSSRGYSTSSLTRKPRRSPSVGRSNEISSLKGTTPRISELQHLLGAAVNALVKHFFTDKNYLGGAQLTPLLCGENGLVPCLEQVFSLGRQDSLFSNRFFRQPYPWDYIEKVFAWFANFFRNGESRKLTKEQRHLIIYAYNLVVRISAQTAVGKEGKFNVFILLALRDRILSGLLPLMAWTPVTAQMYDESAFLRQPHHLSYLSKLLASLNDFQFTLEKSLIYGLDL